MNVVSRDTERSLLARTPGEFTDRTSRVARHRSSGGKKMVLTLAIAGDIFGSQGISSEPQRDKPPDAMFSHDRIKSAELFGAGSGWLGGRLSTAEATPLFQPQLRSSQLRHGQLGLRHSVAPQPISRSFTRWTSSDSQQVAIGLTAMVGSRTVP